VKKNFQTQSCAPKQSGFPRFDVQKCHNATIIADPLVICVRTKSDSISAPIQDCQSSQVVWEWAGEAQLKTETDSLLSIDELAKRLNCHPSTVRRLTKLGRLPAVRIGWLYRYDLEAVLKALKNQARHDSPVR
jgi:excisionase family DNA binding protein